MSHAMKNAPRPGHHLAKKKKPTTIPGRDDSGTVEPTAEQVQKIGEAHGMPQKTIDEVKAESAAPPADKDTPADVSGKRLKSFIERVERLEEEKAGLGEDIKEVYAEAKGTGFDVPTIRKIIKLRKMDVEKRREAESLLITYASAIGLQLELGV